MATTEAGFVLKGEVYQIGIAQNGALRQLG
jgi:hypothetical protein